MKKFFMALLLGACVLASSFAVDVETAKAEARKFMADKNAECIEVNCTSDGESAALFIKPRQSVLMFVDNNSLGCGLDMTSSKGTGFTVTFDYSKIISIKYTAPSLVINYAGEPEVN